MVRFITLILIILNAHFIMAVNYEQFEFKRDASKNLENVPECKCVPYYQCNYDEVLNVNGEGIIDIRGLDDKRSECPDQQFCCYPSEMKPVSPAQQTPDKVPVNKKNLNKKNLNKNCGSRNLKSVLTNHEDLNLAANFPWSVTIFHRSLLKDSDKICVGSLIHKQVVLTTARCVHGKDNHLTIRAGKWNAVTKESLIFQYRLVSDVYIHPNFTNDSYVNDLALLKIRVPIDNAENVNTICLPEDKFFDYNNCVTPGYLKNPSDPNDSSKFQLIGLSLNYPLYCQAALANWSSGKNFPYNDKLMCAKKNGNSDVCVSDDGSPLVCPMTSDSTRFVQVGMLVWDTQCDSKDISGVYVDVVENRNWIKETIAAHVSVEENQNSNTQHQTSVVESNDPKKNIFYFYYEPEEKHNSNPGDSSNQQQQSHTNYEELEKHYPNIYTQQYLKLTLNPKYKSSDLTPNIQY